MEFINEERSGLRYVKVFRCSICGAETRSIRTPTKCQCEFVSKIENFNNVDDEAANEFIKTIKPETLRRIIAVGRIYFVDSVGEYTIQQISEIMNVTYSTITRDITKYYNLFHRKGITPEIPE